MHYYGTRLSENISRREPEGYLFCLNVPVARTGTQEYLPEELGLPSGSALIPVLRLEEEVFSPETMASFEGMPVTNDHPAEGVDVGNIRALQKGHAHNVRRGSGDDSDLLLADLIITDPHLIDQILEEGKREISCGYTYELCEENGQYIQRKIRGNHVAVVDAGRAGPRVSIKDRKPEESERSKPKMKKSLVKKLVRMAKDGDPEAIEAVAELLEEISEGEVLEPAVAEPAEEVTEAVEELAEDPAAVVETPSGTTIVVDEEVFAGILERLDQIIALLTPAARDEDPVEELVSAVGEAVEGAVAEAAAEDPAVGEQLEEAGTEAGEISEIVEEILEPIVSEALDPETAPAGDECGEPDKTAAEDALRAALNAVRPVLAQMPKKQRAKVAADIAASIRKKAGIRGADGNTYAALAAVSRRKSAEVTSDLGKKIMASRNPNYRK